MTAPGSIVVAAALLAGAVTLAACGTGTSSSAVPGGDPSRGQDLIVAQGCGSCHVIDGIDGADGRVGPALANFKRLRYITGSVPTTPRNTVRFIVDPQRFNPDTVMPDLGLSAAQARDITAYLYGQ